MVDCSIIIVSWNVVDLLRECLQSIIHNPHHENINIEILVVDSASQDNTLIMLADEFPTVQVYPQSSNIGFVRANNIGLQHATGKYLMLLNPDTQIIDDAIPQMMTYLSSHAEIGIVGPHTLNTDGSHQSTRRHFPTRLLAFFESTWLQPFAPPRMLERYYVQDVDDTAIAAVDWVQGSALMARREVYDQIGGLDEKYRMYWEELDWCKRAKDQGWEVSYLGPATIIHHGGKSSEQVPTQTHIHFQTSKIRYFHKFHGAAFAFILRLFLLLNYGWQLGIEGMKWIFGNRRALRSQRVRTYLQVLRSGLRGV